MNGCAFFQMNSPWSTIHVSMQVFRAQLMVESNEILILRNSLNIRGALGNLMVFAVDSKPGDCFKRAELAVDRIKAIRKIPNRNQGVNGSLAALKHLDGRNSTEKTLCC